MIVGVELSGNPNSGAFEPFIGELERARAGGVKVSLHCAETVKQKDESQQMIDFAPDRLGHCCYLTKQQIKEVCDKNIPVEICPTSNVVATQCAMISMLPHLYEFKSHNHNLIVCCDDTLIFNTNQSMELFEFAKAAQIGSSEELKKLLSGNVDAIFYDNQQFKDSLRADIQASF
mmetsp:Transcript_2060/g.3645  ORF Transcript_2060/g.3645 Transcript_2060/m.3645 type:complete len:175 (-) Transcript_2060:278-802(-)